MRNVLIPTKLSAIARDILEKNNFTVVQDADASLIELAKQNRSTSALIVRSEKVNSEIIDLLPELKVIIRAGAGYNTIDTRYARRKNIDVMNTPGANANAVAEEVIAMALGAYRHLINGDISTRGGSWEKKNFMGRELTGKTIGIVGLGHIGQLVVKRLSGFACKIIGYDPLISPSKAESLGVKLDSLENLFEQADIATLHIPETEETKKLIGEKFLSLMKADAILINCARSGILNEDDLREVKKEKNIIFCNDVYDKDEAGEKSVADIADIMLPHLGASTLEANETAAARAAEQLISYVEKGVTTFVVNKSVPDGLDEDHQLLAYYLAKVARCYLGCDSQPDRIEMSFYGGLDEFSNWLIAPIVSGISSEFDPMFDMSDASEYLQERGITFDIRPGDESKKYGKSMTVDLFEGRGDSIANVSVRGTITEGYPMVSRIAGFDKLYFDPMGKSILAVYKDQPGMLAKITSVVAKYNININDIRCPFDPDSGDSIAILKVNEPIDQKVLDEIVTTSGARKAVFLNIEK